MAAEQRDDHMADESKRSPRSPRRSRRETKPITPEKINQETEHTKQNETKHIKFPQDTYTQSMHRMSRTRRPDKWIWVGPPIP